MDLARLRCESLEDARGSRHLKTTGGRNDDQGSHLLSGDLWRNPPRFDCYVQSICEYTELLYLK